jgi:hypothetical protein
VSGPDALDDEVEHRPVPFDIELGEGPTDKHQRALALLDDPADEHGLTFYLNRALPVKSCLPDLASFSASSSTSGKRLLEEMV